MEEGEKKFRDLLDAATSGISDKFKRAMDKTRWLITESIRYDDDLSRTSGDLTKEILEHAQTRAELQRAQGTLIVIEQFAKAKLGYRGDVELWQFFVVDAWTRISEIEAVGDGFSAQVIERWKAAFKAFVDSMPQEPVAAVNAALEGDLVGIEEALKEAKK